MFNADNFWDECNGKVNEDRIKFVEKELGINLPQSYINLIKNCDGGTPIKSDFKYYNVDLEDIWGSGVGSFLYLNLKGEYYEDILGLNKSPPEFFPENLVSFANVGNGDYICFDYRQDKDNLDPPIVYWFHEAEIGKDVSFIAHNFEEFIGMLKEPEDLP